MTTQRILRPYDTKLNQFLSIMSIPLKNQYNTICLTNLANNRNLKQKRQRHLNNDKKMRTLLNSQI